MPGYADHRPACECSCRASTVRALNADVEELLVNPEVVGRVQPRDAAVARLYLRCNISLTP